MTHRMTATLQCAYSMGSKSARCAPDYARFKPPMSRSALFADFALPSLIFSQYSQPGDTGEPGGYFVTAIQGFAQKERE